MLTLRSERLSQIICSKQNICKWNNVFIKNTSTINLTCDTKLINDSEGSLTGDDDCHDPLSNDNVPNLG